MTVSLRTKVMAITSCIIAIAFLIHGLIYYNRIHDYATHSVYKRALSVSQVGQALIDGDTFQKIGSLKDREHEDYKEVKDILSMLSNLVEMGEVFAIGVSEQNLIYLSDGVKENFLLSYDRVAEEGFKRLLDKLKIGEPFYFNDYYEEYTGNRLNGVLLPIFNSNHHVVGIIGYQIDGKDFYSEIFVIRWINILCTVISIVACIFLNYIVFKMLLNPIDKLMNAISKVAKGDFKIELDIQRKDEIGKINRNLNKSCERMRQILGYITVSSTRIRFIAEKIFGTSKGSLVAIEEIANSTREISLISYEQVDKRVDTKAAITYLEEDIRIIMAEVVKKKKGCQVCESVKLIEQMAAHISTIKQKLYELDYVFEIIDKHTVNLVTVTEKQMALSEEFTAMAEELNREAERLNLSVLKVKAE